MKKFGIITGVLMVAVFGLWASLAVKSPLSIIQPEASAQLRNMLPGSLVEYKILSDGQEIASGSQAITEKGALVIPPLPEGQSQETLEYDFSLQGAGTEDAVDLNVILDAANQTVNIKGQGLQSFADVKIQNNKTFIESRADWAGNFAANNPFDFNALKKEGESSFEISFMGSGLGDIQRGTSPNIIQIIVADDENGFTTGGDAPEHSWTDSNQPNQHTAIFPARNSYVGVVYNETYCGNPRLSVCERNDMAQQIQSIARNHVRALMAMTEEFSTVMMQQATMVGMFFDAKQQMDTQREARLAVNEANKTYHPSDQMCRFGTFMRSVADTEEHMRFNKAAFSEGMVEAYANQENRATAEGYAVDILARLDQFKDTFCAPDDNNENGLELMCGGGAQPRSRSNNDIDFTRIVDAPLTLDLDFTDGTDPVGTEEDVLALARHLYYPRAFEGEIRTETITKPKLLQDWRAFVATQSVAHNSMGHILSMKARSEEGSAQEDQKKGWQFMKALLVEFGIEEDEVDALVGERPSYYAQMEVLTKKIYQDPDFYTNLYDKPANVDRIAAAMDAVKLMQGRDRFEAALRREMLTSLLVEQALEKHIRRTNSLLESFDDGL